MSDFLKFARRMIHDPGLLALAMAFAVISALTAGAGVMGLVPIIKLIVDKEKIGGLVEYAERWNEGDHAVPLVGWQVDIPQWIIDFVPSGRYEGVLFAVVCISILAAIGAVMTFMHQYLSITVVARTIAHVRREAFERALRMPLARVTTRGASEFIARIIRDTAEVQRGLIAMMSKAVANITQGVVLFIVALVVGRSLTLIALLVLPAMAIILRKLGKRIRRGTRGALQGQEHLLRVATETVQGLRAVKSNTGEAPSIETFDKLNVEVVRQEMRARLARAVSSPIVELLALLLVGILMAVAAKQIIGGALSVDRFVIAIGTLALAGSKFKILSGLVNEMQAASAPARRILDVLDEPIEEETAHGRPDLSRHRESLAFDNVRLTYPNKVEPALRGVSLKVNHGERIALVGPNGCGKTTLLSLIPRLLTPDSGSVIIDDIDIAGVSLHSLRRQVGVVTQETVLFRGSIADNISFGMDGATRDEIIDAARRAHAHEFINEIPGGYDADIAEQGASLSGGQRQRLAIARAILRNPSILLLDEATSQIDAESEAHINAAIVEFCQERTAIVIAHRMSTVLDADRIIVMNEGQIVDQGTHAELLSRCELYMRLTRTQLAASA